MLTWVMYDIVKDRVRNKVVKCCEKAGIYRVQYSVWLGEMNKTAIKELWSTIEDLIDSDQDRVYIFPMCRDDFNSCILLGQAFDRDLITDEIKALLT
ncbi:MAG: CRISPR-associated endonuclease Cas2 [Candidatus Cloacimonetes bacterium]|nr:CRISPR-associated endonuclease Cas2 [Candidatus Cloacimonadota bacterium]MCK9332772.1 CRISPR-associated endonuclease Cas2 [Candidatus Cloacimonadota bacterium]